jgi:hypothetical protein
MGHIFSTVFGMYIVVLWVALVIGMMRLPIELLSIAFIIIIIPVIIAPIQYRSAKSRFATLQKAGAALKEIEATLERTYIATGLTSYIFLIFDVLRPEARLDPASDNEVEALRNYIAGLTGRVISEVILHGFLYALLIFNFLIPEFIVIIEEGGPLLFPLIFLAIILVILTARWFIFFYWRLLVRRWLRFYQGFIEWGEELERVFSGSTERTGGMP